MKGELMDEEPKMTISELLKSIDDMVRLAKRQNDALVVENKLLSKQLALPPNTQSVSESEPTSEEQKSCENCSNKWVRGLCKYILLHIIYRDRAVPDLCERGLRQLAGSCHYYAEPKPEPTGFEKAWAETLAVHYPELDPHKTSRALRKFGEAMYSAASTYVISEVKERWETTKDIDAFVSYIESGCTLLKESSQ